MSKQVINIGYDARKNMGILSGSHFEEIREHFSVYNDAVKYARYRNRFAPSRRYVITPQGRFEPGLYREIKQFIKENAPDTKINIDAEIREHVLPGFKQASKSPPVKLNLELRDYQQNIVDVCLKAGRGVVVLATAGGKTLTIANLLQSIHNHHKQMKCLVLVPDLGLVNQTYGDFTDYGVKYTYSKWTGSDKLNLGTNIVIANMGIIQSDKSDVDWVQDVDLLIVDEVHKLRKDNKINKLIKKIKTDHKFGFTGTMPEQQLDQWNIVGKIGPVLYERNSFQLRQQNYVAKAKIQVLKLHYKDKPPSYANDRFDPTARFRREQEFISKNSFRNKVITKLSETFNNNSLIMIDRIDHGEELYGILSTVCKNKRVFFIRGDVAVEEREKVRVLMEKANDVVCIAISKIFSTGINIKNLHYIVFAGGGKAKVKIIQSIGRGLRLHKSKTGVIIIDIADMLYYGNQHYMKRLNLYKNEKIKYGIKNLKEEEEK